MKLNKILILAAMTCLPLQQAFSAQIENVSVQVVDVNGGTSQILLDKMSGSMQVVADQLFLDKDADKVAAAGEDYKRLLTEIGDRVFTGYELSGVRLQPGAQTDIVLYARPWNRIISQPLVDLQFSGVEPQTAELLQQRIPSLKRELEQAISGASEDAGDWAGGVLRKMARQQVEERLPEFKAAVDVVQDKQSTVVQVVIYPVGQLVSNIKYELRSEAIPNILLMELKYKYLAECDKLRGLPVAYVQAHKEELEQILMDKLLAEQAVQNFRLQPSVRLTPGANLGVNIMINSDDYKLWFEGYGDVGRDKDNLSGKAHIGKFISPQDEAFGEAEVILDDVQWRFGAGYARYWGKSVWSYMRRMPVGDNDYRLEYNLSPKWRLRAEHFSGDDRNEFGVRYRIHEFLSAEYVYGGDEFYLRIIGNL
ncbi:MAG: hypothetical protein Q4E64_07875 [Phascolarctobacterium sp.]|uniref:hypothetical protein n=1 Tax=Phascolarctobacterium sp. TaxID=2049039 RepID=UPI0026DD2AF3|nr:hypothetical protein [Phascolarctobacterium sp.]MDO4921728.1 hypothetical protein [Phascolarctobacterium sp.]